MPKSKRLVKKSETTSNEIASIAAQLLKDPKTPKNVKRVAGSALTQVSKSRGKKR